MLIDFIGGIVESAVGPICQIWLIANHSLNGKVSLRRAYLPTEADFYGSFSFTVTQARLTVACKSLRKSSSLSHRILF